jgi:hypothetical protein
VHMLTCNSRFVRIIVLLASWASIAAGSSNQVVIRPREYSGALRNPLKGFRPDTGPRAFTHEYGTLARCYLKWNELENSESDGVDRIMRVCNERWKDVEKHNVKVIPRVYLDWDEKIGNEYWPADMKVHDYSSEQFKQRVKRLVERLGECWDNDPRVAWVQLGIIGYWGEHHNPSPDEEMQKLLGDAFTAAFQNKKVTVRHPWEFADYEFGIYWDSWAHIQQVANHGEGIAKLNAEHGRWKVCPMDGECAYNWGRYQEQPGDNPNDTLRDPGHRDWLIDTIRWLHGNDLGWVANYDGSDPLVEAGAQEVQKAFGYRFVIEEVRYDAVVELGQAFRVSFSVRNTGSAPFYYNWPVEVSLLEPESREVVWRDIFTGVDIRSWLPGDQWNKETKRYEVGPKTYQVGGSFAAPGDMRQGDYILAVAILDPAGTVPAVRFAIENYFVGGRHPVGVVGVGRAPLSAELDPTSFDDPAQDRTLHYEWSPSEEH